MLASVVALANWRGREVPPLLRKGVKRWVLKTKDDGDVAAGTAGAAAATGDAIGVVAGATAGAAKDKRY